MSAPTYKTSAGNITSVPILDVLYELYAHNRVVALKLNPVTDGLLDVFNRVLAPLIDLGRSGSSPVAPTSGGTWCTTRRSTVHMTGSAAIHDAIVSGTGTEGAGRKKAGTPLLDKPATSELGGVSSPTIVLPGGWSEADLRYQAEHISPQKL
ncbi:hypothetical protein [Streptomyces sp. NPDC050164]|uniref:hypothetical protein n=1 Tax=Streptomyces sp. NPDC050164 TaxID=3365605 RepID=UPI0037906892